jgi:hypothetical protein
MMKFDHLRIPVPFAGWSARGVEFAHGPRKS